ncbi:DUF992 domain-containing protein [Taklimakanibacter albus]|jgi:hypothetical protein|uniref:DUF992 domain-containing protein n=1 Tax=Taklimakanibacter albus TaxID=2800327 RepID=A0ACC5R3X8_9HYPH|nr:DUF992 domain-containing protein [Aestuariivirga sp. YIM B02566]MBK1867376.1 DUF992 domain-containing protein [Aestuariivirga sp. YIM B02566]
MRKLALAAAAVAALGLSAPAADAKTGVKIGVLTCSIEGGVGLILVSSKKINCVYQPSGGGRVERYEGRIRKLGVDIGVTNQTILAWAVFAPGKTKRGALEGTYLGATAEATVVAGLGANVLIGGFKKTISLQPLSIQVQTGLNVAAGVAGLYLDFVRR